VPRPGNGFVNAAGQSVPGTHDPISRYMSRSALMHWAHKRGIEGLPLYARDAHLVAAGHISERHGKQMMAPSRNLDSNARVKGGQAQRASVPKPACLSGLARRQCWRWAAADWSVVLGRPESSRRQRDRNDPQPARPEQLLSSAPMTNLCEKLPATRVLSLVTTTQSAALRDLSSVANSGLSTRLSAIANSFRL
jgi:hypothetical protein